MKNPKKISTWEIASMRENEIRELIDYINLEVKRDTYYDTITVLDILGESFILESISFIGLDNEVIFTFYPINSKITRVSSSVFSFDYNKVFKITTVLKRDGLTYDMLIKIWRSMAENKKTFKVVGDHITIIEEEQEDVK